MAATQPAPQDQEILAYLTELKKVGLQVTNPQGMIAWFKAHLEKGIPLEEIKQTLKDNNYDFKKVEKSFEQKLATAKAIKKVDALETKIKTEEQKKKDQSQLNFIITAFMIAAVSAGSAWFIGKQTADIDTSVVGEAGGILTVFIKAGWIIGIAAGFVGLLLVTMFISEKFKDKGMANKK